jgi:hypothetical protein
MGIVTRIADSSYSWIDIDTSIATRPVEKMYAPQPSQRALAIREP